MPTLGRIRRATPSPSRDLWPLLRARLREAHPAAACEPSEERVRLDVPRFTWAWRLAAAAAIAVPLLVPEPFRFLTASGLL